MLADRQSLKPPAAPLGMGQARQIDSATLLGSKGEVFIVHHKQVYRLRVTAQGKLILTK
jgi:hemin uptake protein HemP